jgi:TolB-like protein
VTGTVPGRWIVVGILVFTAIMVTIAAVMLFGHPRGKEAPPPSIAVLPLTGDDGTITAEIRGALKPIPNFQVIDATTLSEYRRAPHTIGQKLNVRTVLGGSVDHSRVTIKLINAADEFELWSHVYEHNADFKDALARDVAAHLTLK